MYAQIEIHLHGLSDVRYPMVCGLKPEIASGQLKPEAEVAPVLIVALSDAIRHSGAR